MPAVKFDIEKDNKYPCFCLGCLGGKKQSQMSQKDARYCLECQPIIEYEYSLLADKGSWKRYKPTNPTRNLGAFEPLDLGEDTHKDKEVLLHTNLEKPHEYQNPSQTPTINLGGRPRKDIPIDLIHKLSKQGLSIRQIVRELQEYSLSPMSISRVLSGQRTS